MYAEVDVDLPSHPKSLRLASLLNEPRAWTRMVQLWLWAMKYALDGDLSDFSSQEVAQAMGYSLDADQDLISALKNHLATSGFLDADGRLHDWKDRGKRLYKKKLALRKWRSLKSARSQREVSVKSACTHMIGKDQIGEDLDTRTPLPPLGGSEFEQFWQAYPRKKSKGDAEKAWTQTAKLRPPPDELLSSLESAKRSEDWLKDSGQFIPYPASWLRAKGWEDAPTNGHGNLDESELIRELIESNAAKGML